ncbi:hypothetical protein DFH06DRAFT_746597 [Mycena polygramma]|nr:hypothetical protein DFH06DRAFT_746597 [Mycena polygramma]
MYFPSLCVKQWLYGMFDRCSSHAVLITKFTFHALALCATREYFGPGLGQETQRASRWGAGVFTYLFRALQLRLRLRLRIVVLLPGLGLELRVVVFHVLLCLAARLARGAARVLLPDSLHQRVLVLGLWSAVLCCLVCVSEHCKLSRAGREGAYTSGASRWVVGSSTWQRLGINECGGE